MILLDKLKCNKGESSADFQRKVRSICDLLQINPNWLMVVMYNESGLNAQAVNRQPGDVTDAYARAAKRATGLIQFMPATARSLGTTTQQLYRMTAIEQLDYVYRYFKPYAGKIKNYYDLYMITFFPAAIGKPDNWVIESRNASAAVIARQNPGLDYNKDMRITVAEAKRRMKEAIPQAFITEVLTAAEKKSGNSP